MDSDDTHLKRRTAEKQRAAAALGQALLEIEREDREPDDWERACLCQGLSALYRGIYALAACEANHALTPLGERNLHYTSLDTAELKGLTLAILKRELAEASAEPVRLYPHFGPIVGTGS